MKSYKHLKRYMLINSGNVVGDNKTLLKLLIQTLFSFRYCPQYLNRNTNNAIEFKIINSFHPYSLSYIGRIVEYT
jgi:hypothetical protein